jgi:hypothetical protein
MEQPSRIPNLAVPFGTLGAIVGWVAASALQNPLLHATRDFDRPVTALCAGGTAAALGAYLKRWAEAQIASPFLELAVRGWFRLGSLLFGAGALTGGIVGALAKSPADGIVLGVVCALASLPLWTVVLGAAMRAERARQGSLVAETDRREVWTMLVAVASFATLAELADGPAWSALDLPFPVVALAVAAAAVPITVMLHLRDRRTRAALAVEVRDLRDREVQGAAPPELPTLDLGLGDDLHARVAAGANAYRDHEREVALVIGSPEDARRAVTWAVRRSLACVVLVTLIAGAHVAAIGPWFQLDYAMALCARRELDGCGGAARVIAKRDPLDPRVGGLFTRACDPHYPKYCAELVRWYRGDGARAPEAQSAVKEACAMGYSPACGALDQFNHTR